MRSHPYARTIYFILSLFFFLPLPHLKVLRFFTLVCRALYVYIFLICLYFLFRTKNVIMSIPLALLIGAHGYCVPSGSWVERPKSTHLRGFSRQPRLRSVIASTSSIFILFYFISLLVLGSRFIEVGETPSSRVVSARVSIPRHYVIHFCCCCCMCQCVRIAYVYVCVGTKEVKWRGREVQTLANRK